MTDIVAAIRARHLLCHCDIGAYEHCAYCGTPWPCDAARAADEIERVEAKSETRRHVLSNTLAQRDALAARAADLVEVKQAVLNTVAADRDALAARLAAVRTEATYAHVSARMDDIAFDRIRGALGDTE